MLAWVERLRGTDEEAAVLSLRASVYRKRGEAARARQDLERQRALFGAAGNRREAGRSAYRLYYDAWEASEHRRAIEWAVDAFTNASAAADGEVALSALEALFTSLREVGDLEGARRALEEAQRRTPAEDRARRARLLAGEGLVRLDEDRPALARDAFRRALGLVDARDDRRYFRSIHLNLVHAGLALHDLDGAARDLQDAWRFAEPDGSRRTAVLLRYQEGFSYADMVRICRERPETLRVRVSRALPVLRACLEARGVAA